MEDAKRVRRRLGGGMRQIGLLAAAGIYALHNNYSRLATDHARARELARRLSLLPGLELRIPDSNIVMAEVDPRLGTAREVVARLESEGIRVVEFAERRIRAVLHKDVDDSAVATACAAFERLAAEAESVPGGS
jgi:threonine aldolase